jgi:hypothetical protein
MSISWLDLSKVLIVAAAARAIHEANQPETKLLPGPYGCHDKLTTYLEGDNVKTEPDELPPQLKKWAKKSAQNYANAQMKKWRNWEKAMFEPKP